MHQPVHAVTKILIYEIIGKASFTDNSKATRVRKFDSNILPSVVVDLISGITMFYWLADMFVVPDPSIFELSCKYVNIQRT